MRVFVYGQEFGLGSAIAQRLVAAGHRVTMPTEVDYLASKSGIRRIRGTLADDAVQRELAKADAVIDAELPVTFPRKRVRIDSLAPSFLRRSLEGSGRLLIVTSSAAVLGDTGPVPVSEDAPLRPLRGFAWIGRMEKEILESPGVRGVVVRPAWTMNGRQPHWEILGGNLIRLAKRFRRGTYIGSGENRYSAVHFSDLVSLYCLLLEQATAGMIVHASSETFSMKELAVAVHRGLGMKGEPSGISLQKARRWTPIAESLTRSHALSGDFAKKMLGWSPKGPSKLEEIEHLAELDAAESRRRKASKLADSLR